MSTTITSQGAHQFPINISIKRDFRSEFEKRISFQLRHNTKLLMACLLSVIERINN